MNQKQVNLILKTALLKAKEINSPSQQRNTTSRVAVSQDPSFNNTALIQRSIGENSDHFCNNLNSECIYNVLNLFFARQDLPINAIKTIRQVCKLWQEIIESYEFLELFQQRFITKCNVQQLAIILKLELSSKRNTEFIVYKNLKIHLNLPTNDIPQFLKMALCGAQLRRIETIAFGDVTRKNEHQIHFLLNIIALQNKVVFEGLKKLIFGDTKTSPVKIPSFKSLELLMFGFIHSYIELQYCPVLKKLEYKGRVNSYFQLLEKVIELKEMKLDADFFGLGIWIDFIFHNISWAKKVEIIFMTKTKDSKTQNFQNLIDRIHKNQDSFTNLKKIILDRVIIKKNTEIDLSKELKWPEFSKPIEIIYNN